MTPPAILRFADYELHLAQRCLLRGSERIVLGGRAFDLLALLAQRAGEVLDKDELLERVWVGRVVDENNIAVQIAALRKAVGDGLIVTVAGRGYTLAAAPTPPAAALPPAVSIPVETSSLPATSALAASAALFGRDAELARLRDALQCPGCTTLVGPGGVGKSALAQVLLQGWRTSTPTAAWVDLAALSAGSQLLPAVARSVGAAAHGDDLADALLRRFGSDPWLLVLDNAEHLALHVARIAARLTAASGALRLLVTSQQALDIVGERVERIAPLTLPAAGDSDAHALQSGALALFVARVRAADPHYLLPPDAVPLLRAVCAGLDGLPLALEMAAARVPLLGLQALHDALDQRFAMLRQSRRDAPARHGSLRAALDWSYGLLPAEEQRLLRHLGLFAGSFALDLALAVSGDADGDAHWDGVERFAALVQRSLVTSDHGPEPRHRLFETVRGYALQQLAAQGEDAVARSRLLLALDARFERAEKAGHEAAGRGARDNALAEMSTLQDILTWGLQHEPAVAVRLAVRCASVAIYSPWRREAADLLAACEPVLDRIADRDLHALWWRHFASQLLFRSSPRAGEAACRAVALCREIGHDIGLFWALVAALRAGGGDTAEVDAMAGELDTLLARIGDALPNGRAVEAGTLAVLCGRRGDREGQLHHRLRELDLARRAGLAAAAAAAETNVAHTLAAMGRHDEALQRLQAHLAREGDDDSANTAYARLFLLQVQLQRRDTRAARALASATLAACRRHGLVDVAPLAALLALHSGRPRAAALLLGYALQLFAARGAELPPEDDSPFLEVGSGLHAQWDAASVDALLVRGRRLDEAAADALLFDEDDAAG